MAKHEADSIEVEERSANTWGLLAKAPLLAIPFLLAIAISKGIVHEGKAYFLACVLALLAGAVGHLLAQAYGRRSRRLLARVSAGALELCGDGTPERIPLADLVQGVELSKNGYTCVRLTQTRGGDRDLWVHRRSNALKLLRQLGLGAGQSVASFRASSRLRAGGGRVLATVFGTMGGMLAIGILGAATAPWLMFLLAPALVVSSVLLLHWPSRVEVGGDGVLVCWLGRRRFIAHTDIEAVKPDILGVANWSHYVVRLTLRSGETYIVPAGDTQGSDTLVRTLAQRIVNACHARTNDGARPGSLLMRGERTHLAWVRALRAHEVGGHRTPAAQRDGLWRVAEDPRADAVERAAAVVALGPPPNPRARRRLERAAKASAAPRLRVFIEQSMDHEEPHLAEQLAELECEASRSR